MSLHSHQSGRGYGQQKNINFLHNHDLKNAKCSNHFQGIKILFNLKDDMPMIVSFISKCNEYVDENMEIKLISTILHLLTPETVSTTNSINYINVNVKIYHRF